MPLGIPKGMLDLEGTFIAHNLLAAMLHCPINQTACLVIKPHWGWAWVGWPQDCQHACLLPVHTSRAQLSQHSAASAHACQTPCLLLALNLLRDRERDRGEK